MNTPVLALCAAYYALTMVSKAFKKQHNEQELKPVGVGAFLIGAGALLAGTALVGIALFDRSRGINDGVVIAAGVFLVLFALATAIGMILSCSQDAANAKIAECIAQQAAFGTHHLG